MAFDFDELNQRREARRKEKAQLDKNRKLLRIGFIITGITLVICAATLLTAYGLLRPQDPNDGSMQVTNPPTTQAPTEPPAPDTVIHLVAGGDINVTDQTMIKDQNGSPRDFSDVFLDIAPILASGDLTFANFEGNLVGAPYGTDSKSAPATLMTALQGAGMDLIQTANSYAVYNGLAGLQQTLTGIRDAGMIPLGTYASAAEFQKSGGFVILEIQGIRIAFVAFTKGMDGMGLPAGSEDCVNLLYKDFSSTYQNVDTDGIKSLLKSVSRYDPDLTVALLHWGSENNDQISKTQNKIRSTMLEAGVDAIIGTHSHNVQKVDFNAEAGTLVAYSLGDLLSSGTRGGADFSVLLDLEITKDGTTGEVKITGFDYTPIYIANETAAGGTLRVLRIREAMAAYEANCVGSVSKETYAAMKAALSKIENRIEGK